MPFYGWKNVQGGAQGDEPVNIWYAPGRKEYIRVRSDSDSGISSVEISMPVDIAMTAGEGFLGYRRVSPYFLAPIKPVGQQAAIRRQTARSTGDFEIGTTEDALDMAIRYMKKYPGGA